MGNVGGGQLSQEEIEQLQESTNCNYNPVIHPSHSQLIFFHYPVTAEELQRLYRKFKKIDTDG